MSISTGVTKMSVNLPDELVEELRKLAKERNTTMTEVLKSAIGTEKLLHEKISKGAKILVEEKKGPTKQLIFR